MPRGCLNRGKSNPVEIAADDMPGVRTFGRTAGSALALPAWCWHGGGGGAGRCRAGGILQLAGSAIGRPIRPPGFIASFATARFSPAWPSRGVGGMNGVGRGYTRLVCRWPTCHRRPGCGGGARETGRCRTLRDRSTFVGRTVVQPDRRRNRSLHQCRASELSIRPGGFAPSKWARYGKRKQEKLSDDLRRSKRHGSLQPAPDYRPRRLDVPGRASQREQLGRVSGDRFSASSKAMHWGWPLATAVSLLLSYQPDGGRGRLSSACCSDWRRPDSATHASRSARRILRRQRMRTRSEHSSAEANGPLLRNAVGEQRGGAHALPVSHNTGETVPGRNKVESCWAFFGA